MIEVEKKFAFEPVALEKLLAEARPLQNLTMEDIYYDRDDFQLTTSDRWLRERDGRFELKISQKRGARQTDQYEELTEPAAIAKALGMKAQELSASGLAGHGYRPFYEGETRRRKYRHGDFSLDIDEANWGYRLMEIELMVKSPAEIPDAEQRILELAARYRLSPARVHGKVVEWIRRHRPDHWQALVKAGVV